MDSKYVVDQYEQLRREAMEPGCGGVIAQGLALFLRRGMCAWIGALSSFTGRPAPQCQSAPRWETDLPRALRCDLTSLIADMVMACHSQGMGSDDYTG